MISVVIPVFNTGKYLNDCVDSVISGNGEVKDLEIILIDDGSNDSESSGICDSICAKFKDVCRVIHQENRGLGGARNRGIEESAGDYLLFLDSDDTLVPGAISRLSDALGEENSAPDIVAFNLNSVSADGKSAAVKSNGYWQKEPFSVSDRPEYMRSLPNACGRLWKKKLFTDNGISFPERVWYEDIRTSVKLFTLADSIKTINDCLYNYFQRDDSIMHSSNVGRNREIIDAFDDIIDWFEKAGRFDEFREWICRLCIDHVYIAASVRVLRSDRKSGLLAEFRNYTENKFPEYKEKKYRRGLPVSKRIVFDLLEARLYLLISLLFSAFR
ncbi:MAG: glycosyltransferase family 2 protein [Clostridia bacterium]|nr:glycosyltransferase family 2 protein [Clostridia bacterium]